MIPFFYSFYGGTKKAKRLGVLILQSIQKHKRGLSIVFGAIFSFNFKINRRNAIYLHKNVHRGGGLVVIRIGK